MQRYLLENTKNGRAAVYEYRLPVLGRHPNFIVTEMSRETFAVILADKPYLCIEQDHYQEVKR